MKINPELCAKDEALVSAVKVGGISEVRITKPENETDYIVSVHTLRSSEPLYLATRRNPDEPRRFRHTDVAIATLERLLGVKKFTVIRED